MQGEARDVLWEASRIRVVIQPERLLRFANSYTLQIEQAETVPTQIEIQAVPSATLRTLAATAIDDRNTLPR